MIVLIVLPPSETKRPPPESGSPLDLGGLSFPELGPMRERVIDALQATSVQPDALRRLHVRPSRAGEVARNLALHEMPTRRAIDTYAGPLYEGLDAASWPADVERRAERDVVIVSALWGALRPDDRIPPYRLHVCAWLLDLDRLEPLWRSVLPHVLAEAAERRGPIVDVRSGSYQAVGRPDGLDHETLTLRIRPADGGPAHIGDVVAKRVRGEAAMHLLASSSQPSDPLDVADRLGERWPVEVDPPAGRLRTWMVTLRATA